MALAQSGLGVGGVTMVPLLVFFQSAFGWRWAAVAAGLIIWGFGISLATLLKRSPEQYGTLPDGDEPGQSPDHLPLHLGGKTSFGGIIDFTLGEALRTRAFWLLALGSSGFGMVITTIMVHQFAHMEEGIGLARGSAAIVVVVIGALNSIGRLLGGWLGDHWNKRLLAGWGPALSSISLLILAFATSFWETIAYAAIFGLMWGIAGAPTNSLRGEYFGRASFGKILGMANLAIMPGLIGGPVIAGWMQDELGNYKLIFTIFAIAGALSSLLILLARQPGLPARLALRSAGTPK
jgi:sugar phosphate permease